MQKSPYTPSSLYIDNSKRIDQILPRHTHQPASSPLTHPNQPNQPNKASKSSLYCIYPRQKARRSLPAQTKPKKKRSHREMRCYIPSRANSISRPHRKPRRYRKITSIRNNAFCPPPRHPPTRALPLSLSIGSGACGLNLARKNQSDVNDVYYSHRTCRG